MTIIRIYLMALVLTVVLFMTWLIKQAQDFRDIKQTYTIYLDADNPFEKAYQIEIKVLQQLENNNGENWIQFKETTLEGESIISMSETEFKQYVK